MFVSKENKLGILAISNNYCSDLIMSLILYRTRIFLHGEMIFNGTDIFFKSHIVLKNMTGIGKKSILLMLGGQ